MLKNREGKKMRLRLDSETKFQSIINKENPCLQKNRLQKQALRKTSKDVRFDVINHHGFQFQNHKYKVQTEEGNMKSQDSKTVDELDKGKSFMTKLDLRGHQQMKEEFEQESKTRAKSSSSLPKIGASRRRIETFNKIYYGAPVIKYQVTSELVKTLKTHKIIQYKENNIYLQEEHFEDIFNFLMCMCKTTDKKKIPLVIQNFTRLSMLEDLSYKIFSKIKQRTYRSHKNLLRVHSETINFQYSPQVQMNNKEKLIRGRTKSKSKLNDEQAPIIVKISRRTSSKLDSKPRPSQEEEQKPVVFKSDFSSKLQQLSSNFQVKMQEYRNLMKSPEFRAKMDELQATETYKQNFEDEIKDYYQNLLMDPLLVPSLKQKLISNLVNRIFQSFKESISNYSRSINDKISDLGEQFDRISNFVEMHIRTEQRGLQKYRVFLNQNKSILRRLRMHKQDLVLLAENKQLKDKKISEEVREVIRVNLDYCISLLSQTSH